MKLSYYELEGHLRKEVRSLYVVMGEQELLRELAVSQIRRAAIGEETTPFNFERFDGDECDAQAVVMAANQLPMLGGRRAIVVTRANAVFEGSPELLAFVDDPAPSSVLVLELGKKPDARRKAWKELEKKTTVVVCDSPKGAELERWIGEQARERKLKLGREAVRYLIEEFGSDLRRLLNELEKLSLYAGGERLDLETIAVVLGRGKAQSIFRFVEAVGAGDTTVALRQLGRLLDEGEPPLRILALVDRLTGQLRVAKELEGSRRGESLASLLRVPPFVARNLAASARRLDREGLSQAVAAVSKTDRLLKSSRLSPRVLLESLTIFLCSLGEKKRARAGTARLHFPASEARRRPSRDL